MELDFKFVLAIASSAGSYFRVLAPESKDINLGFLRIDSARRTFYEGLLTSIVTTVFWALTFYSQRIDPLSPEGFVIVVNSSFSGPIFMIGWCIGELIRQKKPSFFPPKGALPIWGLIAVVIIAVVGGGASYGTGLMRAYEDGVVIAKFTGLNEEEQVRLKDGLQINLEQLDKVLGSTPRYYDSEVSDTDSAEKASFDTNQRFAIWGSVYFEEREGILSADVLIRVRDTVKHYDRYSSDDYKVEGTSRSAIIKRTGNDLTMVTIWTLGIAETGENPSHQSAVQGAKMFTLLARENIHDNIAETQDLGLFFMDWGFDILTDEIKGFNWQERADIFSEVKAELESSKELYTDPSMARIYNYYGAALRDGDATPNNLQQVEELLNTAIELDGTYPMPHYNLAQLNLQQADYYELIVNCNTFLEKLETAYGSYSESAKEIFAGFIDNVNGWLEVAEDYISQRDND